MVSLRLSTRLELLSLTLDLQSCDRVRGQVDRPPTGGRLGSRKGGVSLLWACLHDGQLPSLPVDVRPAQAQQLSAAESGVSREPIQRLVVRNTRGIKPAEEGRQLDGGPEVQLRPSPGLAIAPRAGLSRKRPSFRASPRDRSPGIAAARWPSIMNSRRSSPPTSISVAPGARRSADRMRTPTARYASTSPGARTFAGSPCETSTTSRDGSTPGHGGYSTERHRPSCSGRTSRRSTSCKPMADRAGPPSGRSCTHDRRIHDPGRSRPR